MVIDGEIATIVGTGLGVLVALGGYIKTNSSDKATMKEQIKTLFSKNEDKDKEIEEIKSDYKDLIKKFDESQKSTQEGMANIIQLINDKHIELLNKFSEMKK